MSTIKDKQKILKDELNKRYSNADEIITLLYCNPLHKRMKIKILQNIKEDWKVMVDYFIMTHFSLLDIRLHHDQICESKDLALLLQLKKSIEAIDNKKT